MRDKVGLTDISRRAVVSDTLIQAIRIGAPLGVLAITLGDASADDTVDRRAREAMNVRSLGATGDGRTDDTAVFRTALASGATVYVPPGTYLIKETLQIDGATLFGAGAKSILACESPDFNFLTVSGSGTRISNLTLWGAAVDETSAQIGITTSTTSPPEDFALTDVRFSGPSTTIGFNSGIKFEDKATNCRIENCHFERLIGNSSGHGYAVFSGAVDGLIVVGNTFQGSRERSQGRHAVYVAAGGRRVTASHNLIRDFGCEAMCTNAYAHQPPVEQLSFTHNIISRCGGVGLNQSSISVVGKARTIRVEGNIIVDSFGCGILCDAGSVLQENVSVDGNTVIDSAYLGIRQLGAIQQTVRDNFVRGSSRSVPGKWADIVVGAGAFPPEQILVSGNQCVGVPGVSARSFLLHAATPLPISVKIQGNDFPTTGYSAGPDYAVGVLQPVIDGRLQFRTRWQPPSLAERSVTTAIFAVKGAEPGDIVTCNHPAAYGGVMNSALVEISGQVLVTLANAVGPSRTLDAGLLAIDVWKGSVSVA